MLIAHHLGRMFFFEKPYILIDGRKFGFLMTSDEGEKLLVVHQKKVGLCNREYGFYVPYPIIMQLKRDILFEVKTKKGYTHYIFRLKNKQRMFKGPDDVFVSIARLDTILDAQHITRPRPKVEKS